jgi:hypothetical protein
VCGTFWGPTGAVRPFADEVRERNLLHEPVQSANPTGIVDDPTTTDIDSMVFVAAPIDNQLGSRCELRDWDRGGG